MEGYIYILKPFFENPNLKVGIRELSRLIKLNHTTTRDYLMKLKKDNFLSSKKERIYTLYYLNNNKKTQNLKLFYNLEKLRESNLIEDLEKAYDFPTVILFGSYSNATDDLNSDLDLCIITNIKKEFNTTKYEKIIKRKISIHKFSHNSWNISKKKNPNLINNICNGMVLSGQVEVL